jgi:hypothetical protein
MVQEYVMCSIYKDALLGAKAVSIPTHGQKKGAKKQT